MARVDDLSRCLVAFDQHNTQVVVVEMSQSSWLVAGLVPGVARQPLKKVEPDGEALLRLLLRWRDEAAKAGRAIARLVVAYEAGRDGFWLARWLRARGVETYVIHPTSIPVPRERKRAKTDRLDTALLMRAVLGWLRGEPRHCSMAAIPTIEEEDAKRPGREADTLTGEQTRLVNRMKSALARLGIRGFKPELRKAAERLKTLRTPEGVALPPNTLAELRRELERLAVIRAQLKAIKQAKKQRLEEAPAHGTAPTVRLLARIRGLGLDTADMVTHEVLYRPLRDERAVGRYVGLTGAPDESGSRRREKGLAKAGNARARKGLVQFAWRFPRFQPDHPLAQWYQTRVATGMRKTSAIVALARKLLVMLWRMAQTGEIPEGLVLNPAA
jgi:transposase